ncbi:sensor histidine kinase [Paramagnetospirillum magneticum]|uniref:histidine kinase n=1 Tax=Paramagnetospirillum magneticum (strain ATCC 700264 / AMB-1) TaxID=342108 RepID=Q2VYT2_PARM1|nr:sensor histidine kinase [Paramagnetospirillum magneticum]BAE53243.1 Signal transduction histidine kinase [Paramagnetospirillum magneticum AMB-1]
MPYGIELTARQSSSHYDRVAAAKGTDCMAGGLGKRGTVWQWKGRLFTVCLMVVIGSLWGGQAWLNHSLALADAENLAVSLARSLQYQVHGSLRGVEALLNEVADSLESGHGLTPVQRERYRGRLAGSPEIRNLVVADADGRVTDISVAQPGEAISHGIGTVGDRDYFQALRTGGTSRPLVIGAPVVSRFSGQSSIPVARAIFRGDNSFAGIVVAGIDPREFREQIESVAVEPEGGAALIRSDGIFLARVPRHDEYIGRSVATSPLFRDHLSRSPSGIAHFVSVADGNDKIVAFETLTNYPLVVTVGITSRTALARWKRQTTIEAMVLAVLAASLLMVATLYDLRVALSRRLTEQLAASHDELERQVEERTAHLAASNAELERFAYVASHDLKEPLRSVSGFLQLLDRRYRDKLDAEGHEFIEFAVNAAKRSSAQIDDLLAFSRVGRLDGPPECCDSGALARGALESLAPAMDGLEADVAIGDLPPVWGRPAQLQSVFQNLIGNAVKYHAEGRPPRVDVRAERDSDGMIRFSVADNGIGIEAQYHERVFGIFQRLHPIGRYPGTGIGLAMCRKIIQRHGGRIWLDSRPGAGTTVFFTLKHADGDAPRLQASAQ